MDVLTDSSCVQSIRRPTALNRVLSTYSPGKTRLTWPPPRRRKTTMVRFMFTISLPPKTLSTGQSSKSLASVASRLTLKWRARATQLSCGRKISQTVREKVITVSMPCNTCRFMADGLVSTSLCLTICSRMWRGYRTDRTSLWLAAFSRHRQPCMTWTPFPFSNLANSTETRSVFALLASCWCWGVSEISLVM